MNLSNVQSPASGQVWKSAVPNKGTNVSQTSSAAPATPPTAPATTQPQAWVSARPSGLTTPTAIDQHAPTIEQGIEDTPAPAIAANAARIPLPSGLLQQIQAAPAPANMAALEALDKQVASKAYDAAATVIQADHELTTNTADPAKKVDVVKDVSLEGALSPLAGAQVKHLDKQMMSSSKAKSIESAKSAARSWAEAVPANSPESLSLALKTREEVQHETALAVIAQKPAYQKRWAQMLEANPKAKPIQVLSTDKQNLVKAMTDGIMSATLKNKINQSSIQRLVVATADDGDTLKKNFTVPESISLNGRDYTRTRMLGAGGYGAAFLMTSQDGHKIVLKAFENGNETGREDAVAEIRAHVHAVGGGSHPNVVNFVGAIRHEDPVSKKSEVLVATEFAGGGDLNRAIGKIDASTHSPGEKMAMKHLLIRDMMEGMQYLASERNLQHYDLKPANLFLTEQGKLMVGDFGSSRTDHEKPTGWVATTKGYDSPERIGSEKADVYTLGVIINEVILGQDPHATKPHLNPVDRDSYLGQVVGRMTSQNPKDRPSVDAVLAHPLFKDPTLDQPDLRQNLAALLA